MKRESTPRRYVAFLRAINVGGRNVKMDRLRAVFEALGLANVATFIASGNVIFEAPAADSRALERQIEAQLRAALGYDVATFIRTPAELDAIAGYDPFRGAERQGMMIAFLAEPPAAGAHARVLAYRTEQDDFHIHDHEVYWLRKSMNSGSSFSGAALEKALGMPATMRNATTVRKLAALYGATRDG